MPPRHLLVLGSFLLWTLFVWVGRIRNALADDALTGWDRTGPIVLSATFVASAVLLAVAWAVVLRRDRRGPGPVLATATLAVAGWTAGVWIVRGLDIMFASDHEIGFVVVHTVLAVVSIALAVAVGWIVWRGPGSSEGTQESAASPAAATSSSEHITGPRAS